MQKKKYRIDLPAHMAECDANYLRLMKLFPRLRDEDVSVFGIALGGQSYRVRLEVLERGPYTSLVELQQLPRGPWNQRPRMLVRLYHDARSAEVVECHGARHFRAVYEYPNQHMHLPDEKAQVNRFLTEFLAMCLRHGVAVTEPVTVG
ncbi:MAG: DUF1249 domain-containing protein [Pseudomonadales bacterium]